MKSIGVVLLGFMGFAIVMGLSTIIMALAPYLAGAACIAGLVGYIIKASEKPASTAEGEPPVKAQPAKRPGFIRPMDVDTAFNDKMRRAIWQQDDPPE